MTEFVRVGVLRIMSNRVGVVFDENDSQKLTELSLYSETDIHSLLSLTIETLYKIMEEDDEQED